MEDVCVTVVKLFVTVCVEELSVVTTAPNIKYFVLGGFTTAKGAVFGTEIVELIGLYTAVPTTILILVIYPVHAPP